MTATPSPRSERRPAAAVGAAAVAVLLAVTGCTSALKGDEAGATRSGPPASDSASDATTTTTAPQGTGEDPKCRKGEGKRVRQLPDVEVPAFRRDAFEIPAQTIGGVRVAPVAVAAVDIPAFTVDGGCVITFDAPGGCFGAREITPIEIPSISVPGFTIPSVTIGGETAEGDSVEGDRADADRSEGDRVEQECQEKPQAGDTYISSVYQGSLYRGSLYRGGIYRGAGNRSGIEIAERDIFLDSVEVPALDIPAVTVPAVSLPARSLDAIELPGSSSKVLEGEDERSYSTSTDVLFDFGKAELKPEAVTELQAVVADLKARFPEGEITVEGHTDSVGSDADNQDLSERRAQAVSDFLTTQGGIDSGRVTVTGFGEKVPVAPDNASDPAAQAQNRRVVITARTSA